MKENKETKKTDTNGRKGQSEVTRKERETSSETNEMKGRVTNKQRTGKVE